MSDSIIAGGRALATAADKAFDAGEATGRAGPTLTGIPDARFGAVTTVGVGGAWLRLRTALAVAAADGAEHARDYEERASAGDAARPGARILRLDDAIAVPHTGRRRLRRG
jgi:hypothetical protein